MMQNNWVVIGEGGEPNGVATLHSNEKLKNVNVRNTIYRNEM